MGVEQYLPILAISSAAVYRSFPAFLTAPDTISLRSYPLRTYLFLDCPPETLRPERINSLASRLVKAT